MINVDTKKHCHECAFKKYVPGSSHHIECMRDFTGIKIPELSEHGIRNGWCMWPLNFDPIWVGPCEGFDTKLGNKTRSETNPLLALMALLRR